jgi:transcriptional regulator with XRE-family HTH domain
MYKTCAVKTIRLSVVPVLQESLSDYVRRVISEKGLNYREVARRSGGAISHGAVGHIVNGVSTDVRTETLRALAKGLGVPEDEIFAVARGKAISEPKSPAEFGVLFYGWEEATDEQKAETLAAIRMIAESFQRRREKNPPKPIGNSGKGKNKK